MDIHVVYSDKMAPLCGQCPESLLSFSCPSPTEAKSAFPLNRTLNLEHRLLFDIRTISLLFRLYVRHKTSKRESLEATMENLKFLSLSAIHGADTNALSQVLP